jgi:phosphopantothenoylcysteine decarboxylase / phosphopantothenate---cysteine ligase
MIAKKNIILGISGGIAAYKSAFLIRLFRKAGASVRVVVSSNALEFITRTTLESLSENRVYDKVFGPENDYTTEHISLTDWGDVFVVAPATANIIAKLANGIADDALSTSLLAFNKKIFIAPAMNCKMYDHFATQNNLNTLVEHNISIIEPASGYLACGYEGRGRMEEPEEIFRRLESFFAGNKTLEGKKVLVTAGPTCEAIDPVRYIGNHSSGKMGYAIAEELANRGAVVELVSGPVNLSVSHPNIKITKVVSAAQMYDACMQIFPEAHAAIMAAAVADFSPEQPSNRKIKKDGFSQEQMIIKLVATRDILGELSKIKKNDQILVGFALETENAEQNGMLKLKNKNLDFIVVNTLEDPGAGFESSTNKVTIINNKNEIKRYPLKGKQQVAEDIISHLEICFNA